MKGVDPAVYCPDPSRFRDLDAVIRTAQDAYGGPGRHYHTWAHAEAVLRLTAEYRPHFTQPVEVWAALLFHDAVYDARRGDNEAQSADLAVRALEGSDVDGQVVRRLIMRTAAHGSGEVVGGDDAWVMDLDTHVLGAAWPVYAAYAQGVAAEYRPVVGAWRYAVGRARFLRRMASVPRIFHTDAGEARWGASARANLARERAGLGLVARMLGR